ncbi:MAG TPA: hypothetical protein VF159_12670 [Gemmatimonadaceae bacterium]
MSGSLRDSRPDCEFRARRRVGLPQSVVAACVLAIAGCGVFHVGQTSREGAAVLEQAPKPPPVDSEFDGCGPAGSQPDYALNRRKNRVDEGAYVPVPWSVIARLPWPAWAGFRFRNQWSKHETRDVARYEGAAVDVEGYLAEFKLEVPEPPNCYARDAAHKDFHLWLSRDAGGSKRSSVVVEITPRVRARHPQWTAEHLAALRDSRVRLRVRGWLMLDQMHPEKVERNRRTLWEVHPIMHVDWLTPGGQWVSLDSMAPTPDSIRVK